MKENFVNYEIALKLKELEYNEQDFAYYRLSYVENKEPFTATELEYFRERYDNHNFRLELHKSAGAYAICTAPLYQQVQKWLREKHNMYVLLEETQTFSLITGIGFYYKIIKVDLDTKEHLKLFYSEYFYSTYEEAIKAAILESLKLIKND